MLEKMFTTGAKFNNNLSMKSIRLLSGISEVLFELSLDVMFEHGSILVCRLCLNMGQSKDFGYV